MLNAQDIAKRIGNPSLSQKEDQNDLKQLAEKYPYSQLFSILYLKSLKQSRDVLFEEELKAHSYRISDRIQLYHLIHEEDLEEEVEHETIVPEVQIEEAKTPVIVEEPEVQEEVIPTETTFVESNNSPKIEVTDANEIEVQEEVSETVESPEEEVAEQIEEPEIAPIQEPVSEEIEAEEESTSLPVEEEITSENRDEENSEAAKEEPQEYSLEAEISSTFEELSQDQLEETILHNAYAANYRLDDLSEEEQKKLEARNETPLKVEKVEKAPEEPAIVEPTKSFTSWLHANENFVEPSNDETAEIKAIVTNFKEFDPTKELFGEVEKPKKEFFSATKKGKKSLAEEGLPVSETLAKIYEMQGNYPKAISAYEQLSLINPEKRTFFASLIEKLKKKLNSE